MPNLLAQTGPLAGQRFQVDTEIIVGRVTGDVVLSDPKVSSRHARFRARDDGGLEVEDLGSTNGTHVDGARIDGVTALPDGETVRIGTTEFTVTLDRLDATVAEPVPPDDDRTVIESGGASAQRGAPELSSGAGGATVIRPRAAGRPAEPIVAVQRDQQTVEPAAPPAPAPVGAAPAAQLAAVGAFSPPQARRGGLASRSWVPVVLSYGSVILAAAALIVYFAAR